MGQRNPAPPTGWLKPQQKNGMFTTVETTGAGFLNLPTYHMFVQRRCLDSNWWAMARSSRRCLFCESMCSPDAYHL